MKTELTLQEIVEMEPGKPLGSSSYRQAIIFVFLCFRRSRPPARARLFTEEWGNLEMKNVTVQLKVDSKRYEAAQQFMDEKGMDIEQELSKTVEDF